MTDWNIIKTKRFDVDNYINLAEKDGEYRVYARRAGKAVVDTQTDRDIAELNYQTFLDDFMQNIDI